MEKLLNDFLNGEEVTMMKKLLKELNTGAIVGGLLAYLIFLDLLPKFTIVLTVLALGSLFATHFVKQWAKKS